MPTRLPPCAVYCCLLQDLFFFYNSLDPLFCEYLFEKKYFFLFVAFMFTECETLLSCSTLHCIDNCSLRTVPPLVGICANAKHIALNEFR